MAIMAIGTYVRKVFADEATFVWGADGGEYAAFQMRAHVDGRLADASAARVNQYRLSALDAAAEEQRVQHLPRANEISRLLVLHAYVCRTNSAN